MARDRPSPYGTRVMFHANRIPLLFIRRGTGPRPTEPGRMFRANRIPLLPDD